MSENNKATLVIVAPNNYDVKKYSLRVCNDFLKNGTFVSYGISELEFEFNQTDGNGNLVAIVEYPTKKLLKKPRITLFNGTIEESKSYKLKNMWEDNNYLAFVYPDNNNNKSQIFKIELCKSHDETFQKMQEEELCYEYWIEEQLNQYKEKLSNIKQAAPDIHKLPETNIQNDESTTNFYVYQSPIEEEEEKKSENDNATENNETLSFNLENANAILLNGKIHYLNNNKINLDKNKKYKIEPVYYDAEKQRFYYLPKSYVYEFNTDNINNNSIEVTINNNVPFLRIPSSNVTSKPINHEKSANLELGFGGAAGAGAIGSGIAIVFGLNLIVAAIIIAILAITCLGLFIHGGIKKSKIYTPPKSQKTEYSDEVGNEDSIWAQNSQMQQFNQNFDDPIFWQFNTKPNSLFNGRDSENGQPPTDGDDPFIASFEENLF